MQFLMLNLHKIQLWSKIPCSHPGVVVASLSRGRVAWSRGGHPGQWWTTWPSSAARALSRAENIKNSKKTFFLI